MGFTFDSPISASYSAADKAHKQNRRGTPLPPSKSKRKSGSFLNSIRHPFTHSNSLASPTSLASLPNSTPSAESQLFRPLLKVPQKIYSSTTGRPKKLQHFQPQSQRRSSGYEAPPLVFQHLPPRNRCLTPPPDGTQSMPCSKTDEQTQSPLFKLPEEILLMIYKEVIGNRLLHIVRKQQKLGHVLCKGSGDPEDCKEDQCRGLKLPTGAYAETGPGSGDIIQLLQTCRKIYVDTVQVLYSSNIFDFDSMEGFISMSCTLLPQRFDSIQSIQLDFRFSLSLYFTEKTCFDDWPRWERTWRVLFSMEALQNLWLQLSWPKETLYDVEEKRYLEPLWLMTNMKTFEVSLPPLRDKEKPWDKKMWGSEAPFKITRRGAH